MPATYNGIGTHYYGKKNPEERVGTCRSCRGHTKLTSYDARLWFVVLFIPIFPLGRKRILDECSGCRRHYVLELDKWETAKQLGVSGARDKFRSDPSVDNAIELHQTLVGYHQLTDAAEFCASVQTQFADSSKFHAYLGVVISQLGNEAEAMPHFLRAHELRPDLPEARVGIALARTREGLLDEARALLDFLEKPGAAQLHSLEPLEYLADAYQKAQRHAEALDLYKVIFQALPAVADHKSYRKRVAMSEKALKRPESILPKRKFSLKNWLTISKPAPGNSPAFLTKRSLYVVLGLVGVIALVFAISNEYIRQHRALYFFNALNQPVSFQIAGVGNFTVKSGRESIVLTEGKYRVVVTAPVRQEFDFEVRSDYWDRWGSDAFWALNLGEAAILMEEVVTYSRPVRPSVLRFHYGRPFVHLLKITHPVGALPQTLSLRNGETRVLSRVEMLSQPVGSVVRHLVDTRHSSEALRLAEWGLGRSPEDRGLLQQYVTLAIASSETDAAKSFMESRLSQRPIPIEWHRGYQQLFPSRPVPPELVKRYDDMVQSETNNASLLYLRGRLSDTRAESRRWYETARQADPRHPYPHFALGYEDMLAGKWSEALTSFQQAHDASPEDEMFASTLGNIRFAVGDFDRLIADGRSAVEKAPDNLGVTVQLMNGLVAKGQTSEAETVQSHFERLMRRTHREASATVIMWSRSLLLYEEEKYSEMESAAREDKSPAGRIVLTRSLVEQGNLDEADKLNTEAQQGDTDAYHHLMMSILWQMKGDLDRSRSHAQKAMELLSAGDGDAKNTARLLTRPNPPASIDINELSLSPSLKALLLTQLALKHPTQRVEYVALARKFNREPGYPRHVLRRIHNQLSPE